MAAKEAAFNTCMKRLSMVQTADRDTDGEQQVPQRSHRAGNHPLGRGHYRAGRQRG